MGDRGSGDGGRRRRLEGVIPELIKRAVELGVEKATEAPDTIKHFVNDLKLPKEIAGYLLTQVDETKNGLFRVVAKEMRDFLEHTNVAGEAQKLLTTVQFEINTTIRFRPNTPAASPTAPTAGNGGGNGGEPKGPHDDTEKPTPQTSQVTPLQTSISKPEVKTQVHVTRSNEGRGDGASRRERRRRGGGSGSGSGNMSSGGEGGQS